MLQGDVSHHSMQAGQQGAAVSILQTTPKFFGDKSKLYLSRGLQVEDVSQDDVPLVALLKARCSGENLEIRVLSLARSAAF